MSIISQGNAPKKEKPKRDSVLYVVLHGSISLVDRGFAQNGVDNGFKAYLLRIQDKNGQDEHKYKFGKWLLEKDIPERKAGNPAPKAALDNVEAGTAEIDPTKDVVLIRTKLPNEDDPIVRAIIELKRPRRILQFRSGILTQKLLTGVPPVSSKKLAAPPVQISQVRVFEYLFQDEDFDQLSLDFGGGARWQPDTLAFTDRVAAAVLHIYDEPDAPLQVGSDHNDREFKQGAEFLGNSTLVLKDDASAEFADDPDVPPGLLPEEIFSLAERESAIFSLVFDARVKQFGKGKVVQAIDTPPGSGLCAVPQAQIAT